MYLKKLLILMKLAIKRRGISIYKIIYFTWLKLFYKWNIYEILSRQWDCTVQMIHCKLLLYLIIWRYQYWLPASILYDIAENPRNRFSQKGEWAQWSFKNAFNLSTTFCFIFRVSYFKNDDTKTLLYAQFILYKSSWIYFHLCT